jgi:hypothetical protein
MAENVPLGTEFMRWQNAPSMSGGVPAVLGAYLANKAGLIDLNDENQKQALQKNGLFGTVIGNQLGMNKAVPPKLSGDWTVKPNYSLGGVPAPQFEARPSIQPVEPPNSVITSPVHQSDVQGQPLAFNEDLGDLFDGVSGFAALFA